MKDEKDYQALKNLTAMNAMIKKAKEEKIKEKPTSKPTSTKF